MKKHILSRYSKKENYSTLINNYYDGLTQMSYIDKNFSKKLCRPVAESKVTNTIEVSDPDEFMQGIRIERTFTIENSDNDEFYMMSSSVATATIEESDPDEFNIYNSSVETRSIETSDTDEFDLF